MFKLLWCTCWIVFVYVSCNFLYKRRKTKQKAKKIKQQNRAVIKKKDNSSFILLVTNYCFVIVCNISCWKSVLKINFSSSNVSRLCKKLVDFDDIQRNQIKYFPWQFLYLFYLESTRLFSLSTLPVLRVCSSTSLRNLGTK